MVLDAFRGHFDKVVKEHNAKHKLLSWLLMDGGITPKAQPLDVLVNKIFKGFFRDLFEDWSLNAPLHPVSGHPLAPSRQLLAGWVVQAWEKVPVDLIKRAWEVSGYRPSDQLEGEARSTEIVESDRRELGSMVKKIAGTDAMDAWIDRTNGNDEPFPESDDNVDWDVGTE